MSTSSAYEQARQMGVKRTRFSGIFGGGKQGCGALIGLVITPVLICGFLSVFFVPKMNLKLYERLCPGTEVFMLKQITRCKAAKNTLGKKRRFEWGLGLAAFEHSSGSGSLEYNIPVGGSNGSGRLVFRSTTSADVHTVQHAMLTVGKVQIDLKQCGVYQKAKKEERKRYSGKKSGSKKPGAGKLNRKSKKGKKGKKGRKGKRR